MFKTGGIIIMTENKAAAFVALAEVQSKLGVRKSQQNNFGGYAYYSVGDILNELKPLLIEHQAAVYFNESLEVIGERIYVHSTAHFVYQGYEILATGMAREEENPTGKSSYHLRSQVCLKLLIPYFRGRSI